MKKIQLIGLCLLMASCVKTGVIDADKDVTPQRIGFAVNADNMVKGTTVLQNTGHYNFGVFAYKSTDATNNIMSNYLVGYMDEANKKGYYFTAQNQTTMGDAAGTADGKSMWQYEMLGSDEYGKVTNETGENYYLKSQTQYMSNNANQYLRYWDLSADNTCFYAYAPYINGTGTATFNNSTKVLTIPDGTIVAGYDDPTNMEYMYAYAKIEKASYNKDVTLKFNRLNAKVNIKFYEDIKGYSVKILNLKEGYGVSAAPAIAGTPNTQGEYFAKSGVSIDFSAATPAVAATAGTKTSDALNFAAPTAAAIGETNANASASATTYYAIPKNNTTGFTFHVTYQLTSTTGEKITVTNAKVFVPTTYTNWEANKAYTYVFKITKNSNGTTGVVNPADINPNDPKVDTEKALYPIVFDGCTVEDYTAAGSEHTIS